MVLAFIELEHRFAGFEVMARQDASLFKLHQHSVYRGEADVGAFIEQDLEHVFGRHVTLLGRTLKNFQNLDARQCGFQAAAFEFFCVCHEKGSVLRHQSKRAARMGNHIDLGATSVKWGLVNHMLLHRIRYAFATVLPLLALGGCSSTSQVSLAKPETLFGLIEPYRMDVVQGNVVTQEFMAQIQPGFGRMQVREILGTPLLTDVFHADRWDYVFTIRRQGVPDQKRRVTVYFKNDAVERFESETLPMEREFVASIDKYKELKPYAPNLTDAQIAALPAPDKANIAPAKVPQGANRSYPPLDAASR